nr:glycosyltransferase [Paracoccus sp. IB05]
MIVRDEAEVILETLENLLAHIDLATWVIHDTGSRDNTPDLITDFFARAGIPGRLIHRPWESFGANRQYALADAQGLSDYVLFFDADSRFEGRLPTLPVDADAMMLNTRRGSTLYPSKLIVRNDGSFRWRGVVHEGLYFQGRGEEHVRHVDGDYALINQSAGARSRDPSTYFRDARALVQAVETLPAEDQDLLPRYTFYCANSWRDAHAPQEAIPWYRKRIALGGWKDEVCLSWLGLGIELTKTGDQDGALLAFLSGHETCPDRAECLYQAARMERMRGRPHLGLVYASEGRRCPMPDAGRLFVWRDVYRYWLTFELLLCLKDLGRLDEGANALRQMRTARAPDHLYALLGLSPDGTAPR